MSTKNRNAIVQWEVTYPQSGDEDKLRFHERFPPSVYSICAKENHEVKGVHLHMGIKLKKGLSKKKMLDWLETMFPDDFQRIHVSPIKKWENWIDYCKKEDANCHIRGDLDKKKVDEWALRVKCDCDEPIHETIIRKIKLEKELKLIEKYSNCCEIVEGMLMNEWEKIVNSNTFHGCKNFEEFRDMFWEECWDHMGYDKM
jgi:hypothetical protein